jgi:hypothetical protein
VTGGRRPERKIFDWGLLIRDLGFSPTIKNPKSTINNQQLIPQIPDTVYRTPDSA